MNPEAKRRREEEILNIVLEVIRRRIDPARVVLFGSRARKEEFKGNPDFDLAIDADCPDLGEKNALTSEIESVAGLYKIDIVFLPKLERKFRDIILKSGKEVYVRGN